MTSEQVTFLSEGNQLQGYLRAAEASQSKAVVFCHGAFEFQDNWFEYAERMWEEGISTFTFDFTGHGNSEGLPSLVDLKVWAYNIRDALNTLKTRGYQEFALVGWGIGGSAALLAAAHDKRLRTAVVLAAPVYLVPNIGERLAYGLVTVFARLYRAIFKRPLTLSRLNEFEEMRIMSDEDGNLSYLQNQVLRSGYETIPMPESLDSVWFDIRHSVAKVAAPVLVRHGDEDEIIPLEQSERLMDVLEGKKKLKVFEGCGHALHLDIEKNAVYSLAVKWIKKYLDPAA